jgi:acyl dehydratase
MRREVDAFRERIGIDLREPLFDLHYEQVTLDGIRRYAFGLGDDNPLWTNRAHAAASRWNGIIAPPTFLSACGRYEAAFQPTDEEAARGKDALGGLNLMHSGNHIRWFQPIRDGDQVRLRRFYVDCVLRGSSASGWTAVSTYRGVFRNQRDDVIGIWDVSAVHPHEQPSVDYVAPPRAAELLDDIDAAYDAEEIRGAEPRLVESVTVGDELPKRTKGPLATSDVVAWAQGSARDDVAPNRLGRQKRRAGEFGYLRNSAGGWDSYMSCHWDPAVSATLGMRQPFDWGMMRTAYMAHIVTDWMGDDAILVDVRDRIRTINVVGNVSTLRGQVTGVGANEGWPEVVVEVTCTNQDGVVTASSTARVRLPSERYGLPEHPPAPADGGLLPMMPGYPHARSHR